MTEEKAKTLSTWLNNFESFVGDFWLHTSKVNFGEIRYLNGKKNSSILPALTCSECTPCHETAEQAFQWIFVLNVMLLLIC